MINDSRVIHGVFHPSLEEGPSGRDTVFVAVFAGLADSYNASQSTGEQNKLSQ